MLEHLAKAPAIKKMVTAIGTVVMRKFIPDAPINAPKWTVEDVIEKLDKLALEHSRQAPEPKSWDEIYAEQEKRWS